MQSRLISLTFHSYSKANTKVDTIRLSSKERMFRHNRGQTQVKVVVVVVINGLFNKDNHRCPERNATFTSPQQPLPA
ncbi:hypothetical protein J1N35_005277 [Gossypium stocksii]|uniref:Uncharacterized protein n=1 Tax=Gossypium stocksii TaxID=47602 RepID=A0A9D4AGX9_9ROSI|nr:hypothetical protein J1N35_005277 [Gossypium stocksii]